MIKIKKITNNDVIKNEKLLKLFLKDLRKNTFIGDLDFEIERIYNNMKEFTLDNSAIILGLYDDTNLKGFVWGYNLNNNIHINYFYLSSEMRSQGYGTKLLKELENNCMKDIELIVYKNNINAYNFYLKRNFKIIEDQGERYKMLRKFENN